MVPYYKEQSPGLPQWAGGMQASVVLDQPGNVSFTNLDKISGRVIVRSGKSADIDSIVVKLEGESRSRLLSPQGPNGEKPKPQLEYHKILYRLQTVFPPPEVLEGRSASSGKATYTLPPGNHEYSFSFKIPFNNSCSGDRGQNATLKISTGGLEVARPPPSHVKKTLPPTLSGFPGEAEVRYFVKATVTRHAIWKENPRAFTPFNFFPIEPPRPPVSGNEIYARQKHDFTAFAEGSTKAKMKGIFGMKEKSSNPSPTSPSQAPSISIDARLPEPAILTCNDDLPLRLLSKKLSSSNDMVYLHSLQISLIGTTKVRAHEVFRTETNSWILVSKSNMSIPLGAASDPPGTETVLDDSMWRGLHLPNSVAPSFETCNIERAYQVDIRVGLSYSGPLQGSSVSKPQSIILPLRMSAKIYSGIAPPPELLQAMAETKAGIKRKPATKETEGALDEKLRTEGRKSSVPSSPAVASSSSMPAALPPRPGASSAAHDPEYGDAPPSYEDAIASELPPVDAPRPDYAPPPPAEDDVLLSDEKANGMSRRNS